MKYIGGFARFWFDFIVGEDWRVAVGVVATLVIAFATRGHAGLWWILPAGVSLLLAVSVGQAARRASADAERRRREREG